MRGDVMRFAAGIGAVIGGGALLFGSLAAAQDAPVEYQVSFENAVHHEAAITARFRDLGDAPLDLRMARSSPGRYALHEFAKNVYAVNAVDGAGRALKIDRTDPYSWRIAGHDGAVVFSYTLFADRGDGTYSQIDLTHAHLNMPATFIWAKGLEDRPVTLAFKRTDKNWKAATQLPPGRGAMSFTAPNLQYFMDSPTELSAFDLREWTLEDGQTIRLAVHHDGEKEDVDKYAEKAKKIVAEQIAMFGAAPAFDYGVYIFIADFLPHVSGDGMEHRNSTILSGAVVLYESDASALSALSHEFFHAWNVERMRPVELEPFDFFKANATPSLWFAEGFTNYYGDLMRVRAGVTPLDDYLKDLQKTLSAIVNAPGRAYGSPQTMSLQAPFVDAARAVDPVNWTNVFVSYYPYGEIVGLALDLMLREQFSGVTLDDYMRHLWRAYGETETPYTTDDLRNGLAAVTGDAEFAASFFAAYLEAGGLPDFAPLLAQAGLKLEPENSKKASLGRLDYEEKGDALLISSNTQTGSPLYDAGLDRGDEIIRIGRFKINKERDIERALKRFSPGDQVEIKFMQRGTERAAILTLAADDAMKITPFENTEMELTEAHKAFRKSWLKVEVTEDKKDQD